MMRWSRGLAALGLLALLAVAGCGESHVAGDAGSTGIDAESMDAGTPPPIDAGTEEDAERPARKKPGKVHPDDNRITRERPPHW